jgi:hypothetical protein
MKYQLFAIPLVTVVGCRTMNIGSVGSSPRPPTAPTVAPSPSPSELPLQTLGRTWVVRLEQPVGTDLSKEGDRVQAVLATPVVDRAGHLLVAEGTRVEGQITRSRNGLGVTPPVLELAFDHAMIGGHWRPIHGVVASADYQVLSPGASSQVAAEGRGGGLLLGMIFYNLPGAVIGYNAGAVGGMTQAARERPASLRLPAGSFLTLKLE